MIKQGGYFSYIVSNKFTRASYGLKLRLYLATNFSIKEYIDKLFIDIKQLIQRWDTILMLEHAKSLLQFADDVNRLRQWVVE